MGGGGCLCQRSLIMCDISILDHCQKAPQHPCTPAHTYKHTTQPGLMIQSCDCWLPAMIEPLHRRLQHKSMSITSPEHIRLFLFLLVISADRGRIPIPHRLAMQRPRTNIKAFGGELLSVGKVQMHTSTLNCMHCIAQNRQTQRLALAH